MLGKYEVVAELGQGGMGTVFKARDPVIGRDVAIKVISRSIVNDPIVRKRFYREAQSAGRLSHPNVTVIHDIGEHEGVPYIVMEFLDGTDLRTLMNQGATLSLKEKLEIALQVGQGLLYAHQHHIIHRDIKPDNVRVLDNGRAKVMDFGIARVATNNTSTLTAHNKSVGTPKYMSPEQIQGGEIDQRSDIFSFGVVLYEMLAGFNPFDGPNVGAVVYKIMDHTPPPLDPAASPIHADLQRILDTCLAKDPRKRYDSFAGVIADLQAALEALVGGGESRTTTPTTAQERTGSRAWLRVTAAALLLVLVAGGGYWLWSSMDTPRPTPAPAVVALDAPDVDEAATEPGEEAALPDEAAEVLPPSEAASMDLGALRAAAEQQRTAMESQRRRARQAGAEGDGAFRLAAQSEESGVAAFEQGDREGYLEAQRAFAQAMQGYAAAADAEAERPPPVVVREAAPTQPPPTQAPARETPPARTDEATPPPQPQEPQAEGPALEGGLSVRAGSARQPDRTARATTASRKPAADRARSSMEAAASSVASALRNDARYKQAVDVRQMANTAYAGEQFDRAARLYALAEVLYGDAVPKGTADAAFDQALDDYATLYQSYLQRRDLITLEGLFPRFDAADRTVWARYVDQGGSIDLFTTTSSFDVEDDRATANVSFQLDYTDPQGKTHRSSLDYRWTFAKEGTGWILSEIRKA